jgi:flagellar biosynthesis activator protein FlaF
LPMPLRAQIISLAIWVSKYSSDVLRDGAELDPLIDINRTMMEGLASR